MRYNKDILLLARKNPTCSIDYRQRSTFVTVRKRNMANATILKEAAASMNRPCAASKDKRVKAFLTFGLEFES